MLKICHTHRKCDTDLLKDTPATLERKSGNASKSSGAPEIPNSDNFDWQQERSSVKDVCLTFSAIAPIARAAATRVSQFLLRRNCET